MKCSILLAGVLILSISNGYCQYGLATDQLNVSLSASNNFADPLQDPTDSVGHWKSYSSGSIPGASPQKYLWIYLGAFSTGAQHDLKIFSNGYHARSKLKVSFDSSWGNPAQLNVSNLEYFSEFDATGTENRDSMELFRVPLASNPQGRVGLAILYKQGAPNGQQNTVYVEHRSPYTGGWSLEGAEVPVSSVWMSLDRDDDLVNGTVEKRAGIGYINSAYTEMIPRVDIQGSANVHGPLVVDGELSLNGTLLDSGGSPLISNDLYIGEISYPASLSFGSDAVSTGLKSIAFGSLDTLAEGDYSIALGESAQAKNRNAVALGRGQALGLDSIATGLSSAHNQYSSSGGLSSGAHAFGSWTYGLATNTYGSWSLATGLGTITNGSFSSASGVSTISNSYAETVIGYYNAVDNGYMTQSSWPLDAVFRVGNGVGSGIADRSDALVTRKNGQTTLTNREWSESQPLVEGSADFAGGEALVVEGHARLKGKVIIEKPQGDISMGIFGGNE